MAAAAIRLDSLTKYYGSVVGLEQVSLEIHPGEVFGFLGANGAGKTTTIRILLDLLRPTSGAAFVLGMDCRRQGLEVRSRIGYLPGEMPMYPELTGAGYLKFLSSLGPVPPAPKTLEALFRRFDVSEVDLSRRMRDYSHGMKRKMGIIQALMTEAPVVILDEPTSGLDPLMIEAFGETIDELARGGQTTIFLSSHVLSEVDRVCHRIGLIHNGRLGTVKSLDELRASALRRVVITLTRPVEPPDLPAGAVLIDRHPRRWVIELTGPMGPLVRALTALPVEDIEQAPFTLEDVVLRLFAEARAC